MGEQINLRLNSTLLKTAKEYAEKHGFNSVQEFIKEALREKLFDQEKIDDFGFMLLSEKTLAKDWLSKEEDEAWKHLQKEV